MTSSWRSPTVWGAGEPKGPRLLRVPPAARLSLAAAQGTVSGDVDGSLAPLTLFAEAFAPLTARAAACRELEGWRTARMGRRRGAGEHSRLSGVGARSREEKRLPARKVRHPRWGRTLRNKPGSPSRKPWRPGPESGAGDEIRTRDSQLGKLTLYQLSYARVGGPSLLRGRADLSTAFSPVRERFRAWKCLLRGLSPPRP